MDDLAPPPGASGAEALRPAPQAPAIQGETGEPRVPYRLYALKDRKKRFGLQTMCEGGGLANVTIYESL